PPNKGHIYPKLGKRDRGSVSAHPGVFLSEFFKTAVTKGFVKFPILSSSTGLSGEDRVEQSPQTLRLQEGDRVSLNCTYTVSSFNGLQWYRQDPGQGPELLFLLYSVGAEKQKERLTATLLKKGSSLHIEASKPEDSATYFCAVETQCSQTAPACPQTLQLHAGVRAPLLFLLLEEVLT
uniref:Ig-like domain-containing protein n=1 Tax=Ursus maritimus TaxID=29073 RepID=A0A452T3M4_URSMA